MTASHRGELDALRDDLLVVLHQASEVRDAFDGTDPAHAADAFEVLHLAITATAARVRSVGRPEVDSSDPVRIVGHALRSWGQIPHSGPEQPRGLRVSLPPALLRQMLEDLSRQARARHFPLLVTVDSRGGAWSEVVITATEAPSCTRLVVPDPARLDWLCLATDLISAHGGTLLRFEDPQTGARRTTVAVPALVTPHPVVAG